ncbi:MAG: hypothetical protein LLG04_08930 [Parachlamydia sp.]|nr:hypothetical protein [Parachlamydia sp.]
MMQDLSRTNTITPSVADSVASLNTSAIRTFKDLNATESAERIRQVSTMFADGKAETIPGTGHLKFFESPDGIKYFGINKNDQTKVDFSFIKSKILEKLGLAPNTPVIQIIGDSGKFSPEGTAFATQQMAKVLANNPNALFLWGYTASGAPGNDTADVNGIFNALRDANPDLATLANVVDFGPKTSSDPQKIADTATVIHDYKAKVATASRVFCVVYNKAQFGDDIESSDPITDLAYCYDGGAQSWRQIVNCLSQNGKIFGDFNLRGEKNPATFVKQLNDYATFFSAGEFIFLLSKAIELFRARKDSQETLIKKFGEYSKQFSPAEWQYILSQMSEKKNAEGDSADADFINGFKKEYLRTRLVFNPDRHDAETKAPLFEAAWTKFMAEKLWLRLSNCDFQKFSGFTTAYFQRIPQDT